MKPHVITVALLLGLVAMLVYGWGYAIGQRNPIESAITTKVDTLIVHDTLRIEKPVEVAHNIIKERTVEVPVYIETKDTVIKKVYVPREERQYKDESYFAVVSGVDPSLDYLEVFPKNVYITKTETVYQNVKPRWSVGIHGGYGLSTEGLTPYIGIGLSYNLFSFGYSHK